MPRSLIITILLLLVVAGVLFGLASLSREVPVQPVEKAVTNEPSDR